MKFNQMTLKGATKTVTPKMITLGFAILALSACGKSMGINAASPSAASKLNNQKNKVIKPVNPPVQNSDLASDGSITSWSAFDTQNYKTIESKPFIVSENPVVDFGAPTFKTAPVTAGGNDSFSFVDGGNVHLRSVFYVPDEKAFKKVTKFSITFNGLRKFSAGDEAKNTDLSGQMLCTVIGRQCSTDLVPANDGGTLLDPTFFQGTNAPVTDVFSKQLVKSLMTFTFPAVGAAPTSGALMGSSQNPLELDMGELFKIYAKDAISTTESKTAILTWLKNNTEQFDKNGYHKLLLVVGNQTYVDSGMVTLETDADKTKFPSTPSGLIHGDQDGKGFDLSKAPMPTVYTQDGQQKDVPNTKPTVKATQEVMSMYAPRKNKDQSKTYGGNKKTYTENLQDTAKLLNANLKIVKGFSFDGYADRTKNESNPSASVEAGNVEVSQSRAKYALSTFKSIMTNFDFSNVQAVGVGAPTLDANGSPIHSACVSSSSSSGECPSDRRVDLVIDFVDGADLAAVNTFIDSLEALWPAPNDIEAQ